MKSYPNMIDMKSEKTPDPMGLVAPSEGADYDYGLQGSFNQESLGKLGLDKDVHVGSYLSVEGFMKVTGVHMKPGSDEIDRVDWCLCHINLDDDDDDKGENKGDEE